MTTISSHVLDSVTGTHASGIRVCCYQLHENNLRSEVFDIQAGIDGRIAEAIHTESNADALEYELVFFSSDYYASQQLPDDGYQIMNTVVVRLSLPDPGATYHVPLMLAPHSYSVWWSGAAKQPDPA